MRLSSLKHATGALILLAMMLTGVFGELARASHQSVVMIGGVAVPLCGDPAGGDGLPMAPGSPGCCDLCVLGAPGILPGAPALFVPATVQRKVALNALTVWVPVLSRPRTPRQSQGPPLA